MDLKELLGEELYNQVIEKAGDKHKIAIVSDGTWFPKEKFDEVNTAKKKAEDDLKERDKQLEALSKSAGDNEALKGEIKKLQDENKATAEKYEAEVKSMKIDTALKLALKGEVHDADLVASLINKDGIKIKEDGTIESGFEEQVKSLRESKGFLFVEKSSSKPSGWKPYETGKDKDKGDGGVGADFAKAANESGKAPAAAPNPWG